MSQFTKIIYILLATLIVLMPHLGIGHFVSIPEPYAQSLVTVLLLAIAYSVYLLHLRDIRKKNEEKKKLENEFSFSGKKLNEAYQYIGSVNRKLSLLHNVSTVLLNMTKNTTKGQRAIFEELLATAVTTLSHSSFGIFRFIQVENGRTEKEFTHTTRGYILLKSNISNKELLQISQASSRITEMNNLYVISTSDRDASIQCFLMLAKGENDINTEISTLQAVVDQAQLFYKYFSEIPRDM